MSESEPPSKIAKLDSISGSSKQNKKEEKAIQWFVVLCYDVLLEVLRFGNRCQLVSVERVGRRIHLIVENYFGKTPFLHLGLLLKPRQFEYGLEVFVSGWEIETSLLNAESFPPFLRFNSVEINTSSEIISGGLENWDTQPIAEKCKLIEDQLQLMKPALDGSHVSFSGHINNEMQSFFNNHDQVLEYLRNQLLPICAKSRGFDFCIVLYSDEGSATNIIASILQMEEVKSCSNLSIIFYARILNKLPIEEISNWLHRSCDDGGQRERSLLINLNLPQIENRADVLTHLKETFQEAKSPVQPWTFTLEGFEDISLEEHEEVERQTLTNKITNEEMSVHKPNYQSIEIKRAVKKKKN